MEKIRIDLDFNEGFNFLKVPKPKFKVGQEVYYVNYCGDISKHIVATVEWDVKFHNNGYVNFTQYIIAYSFEGNSLSITKCEDSMFDNHQDAINLSSKIKEERLKYFKENKEKRIKELTTELAKLLNDE